MKSPSNDAFMDPAIWCAIPVYNNAATIADIARRCREQIAHVLVIDDGSTDADLTELLKPVDVTVLRHPANLGKGKALLTAFKYAAEHGAEYLITLDGDGQHFPQDIPRFIPHLSPDKILIGYRDEITGDMPRRSRFGRQFSDFWIQLEAGGNARDTQSGFRAYPLAAVLQMQLDSHFYSFEMEIITKAVWGGLRIGNVPIRVWYPPADDRVSSFHPLRDNLRISLLHTRLLLRQILPIPHRRIRLPSFDGNRITKTPVLRYPEEPGSAGVQPGSSGYLRTGVVCDVEVINPALNKVSATPINLAITAALTIIMGIVLWPWGFLPVAYVTIRLHLNKIIALACVAACMPAMVPRICMRAGRFVVQSDAHPHLRWIAGAHMVALPVAAMVSWLVYAVAAQFQKESRAVPGPVRGETPRLS